MIGSVVPPAGHTGSNLNRRPLPVRYDYRLLQIQAALWVVAALGMALWVILIAVNSSPIAQTHSHWAWLIVAIIGFILAGGLSAGSAYLAAGLARGSAHARVAAVVLESFMVVFGWLFATYTATGEGFVDPGPPGRPCWKRAVACSGHRPAQQARTALHQTRRADGSARWLARPIRRA
jgi:hypothetical protein